MVAEAKSSVVRSVDHMPCLPFDAVQSFGQEGQTTRFFGEKKGSFREADEASLAAWALKCNTKTKDPGCSCWMAWNQGFWRPQGKTAMEVLRWDPLVWTFTGRFWTGAERCIGQHTVHSTYVIGKVTLCF